MSTLEMIGNQILDVAQLIKVLTIEDQNRDIGDEEKEEGKELVDEWELPETKTIRTINIFEKGNNFKKQQQKRYLRDKTNILPNIPE